MSADLRPQLTVLMPCLNEAETIESCIRKARQGIEKAGVSGEILIADNGSTDGSQRIAAESGARVVDVAEKGYGSALREGIAAANGRWIVMGDADDSYDFSEIQSFVEKLKEGNDLVMGCRMPGGGGRIMPGAMPWKHRWIGNPVLSTVGRLFFHCPAHDFHCGLRGFPREAALRMDLCTTGMEFASEMVIKANLKRMKIAQVPITLYKDGRSRPPHLRSWRDGWRHLRFMLIYSPRWLFLIPGLAAVLACGALAVTLFFSTISLGRVTLDTGTMMLAAMGMIAGAQLFAQAISAKIFAIDAGLLPNDERFSRLFKFFNLEKGILAGAIVLITGILLIARSFLMWKEQDFGALSYSENMRLIIAGGTCMVFGIQIISVSFFLSVLGLQTTKTTPPNG
ncbi:MAG: glycosyltransferase family 2 protein [Terrimicrobiaceae bacterium]